MSVQVVSVNWNISTHIVFIRMLHCSAMHYLHTLIRIVHLYWKYRLCVITISSILYRTLS